MISQSPSKQKYWIEFHHVECPLCWRDYSYRRRVYDRPKPEEWHKRHIYEDYYDWCEI